MKAFIRKLRRERSRERAGAGGGEDEEKLPPPPPPRPPARRLVVEACVRPGPLPAAIAPPDTPSIPLPATATPTPTATPPAVTPIPTPTPPPAQQRAASPPPTHTQTHSTASSRPSQQSEHGPDSAARRKVAFRSPPPTPGTIPVPLPEPESEQIQIPPPSLPTANHTPSHHSPRRQQQHTTVSGQTALLASVKAPILLQRSAPRREGPLLHPEESHTLLPSPHAHIPTRQPA
ncbi:hypothetical protein RHS01_03022 [Rhizoctonia solani]|uniref:Uncharacterized protein n=1 Tax=Rhizoctonia solani TaxID=456999 RepID=A0A8H7IGT6_9AGAM|nr:hypothetical protein RHS01_03022 [Rhizoctonia solani]